VRRVEAHNARLDGWDSEAVQDWWTASCAALRPLGFGLSSLVPPRRQNPPGDRSDGLVSDPSTRHAPTTLGAGRRPVRLSFDAASAPKSVLWLRKLGGKMGIKSDRDGPYIVLRGISADLLTVATFSLGSLLPCLAT
jgi:hypothetical protein